MYWFGSHLSAFLYNAVQVIGKPLDAYQHFPSVFFCRKFSTLFICQLLLTPWAAAKPYYFPPRQQHHITANDKNLALLCPVKFTLAK
jgi:hypothetical protein